MRQTLFGLIAAVAAGILLADAAQVIAQPPGGGSGPGGFRMPPLPVMVAIDADADGVISEEELAKAPAALKALDKNADGKLVGPEMMPEFGGRGGRGGPGGFGGPGGAVSGPQIMPDKLAFKDGVASIADHSMFHTLSYKGEEVMVDTFLAGLEFVKFTLDKPGAENQQLYFINTKNIRAHPMFAPIAGIPIGRGDAQMRGVLIYRPMLKSPSGQPGLYTFEFEPNDEYSHKMIEICLNTLVGKFPPLAGNVGYYPRGMRAEAKVKEEKALYKKSGIPVYLDADLNNSDVGFLPLNPGKTFGRLRFMDSNEFPNSRDVVLCRTLPNEMPRVAGIITAVRQTPLSHVNLRAVQDHVPNAFIIGSAENEAITKFIGKYVSYKVTADGYEIREATLDEVDAHFDTLRPAVSQVPPRDLTETAIRPLAEIKFEQSISFGVKAANMATLREIGLPEGTVPDGFAIPFAFYDEFMKSNGFYDYARELLANPEFQRDRAKQETELRKFQKLIKQGKMPDSMMAALDKLHKSFPAGTSLRCRSSTNNEDLPGFSGAGLYDSFTHKVDEGHLSKTVMQVYASLWNFRAFEEREFYRVDHFAAVMGVLVHPNFESEIANGVAVTSDILYQTEGNYYVNTQVGEDLVTNPNESSTPEEILLDWWKSDTPQVMQTSSLLSHGKPLLSAEQLEQLRDHLGRIHVKFAKLYGKTLDDKSYAMEIEFKISKDGSLVIKQARPWVFAQTKEEDKSK